VALADVVLQAPLPEPPKIRDLMTFELHYRQSIAAVAGMRVGPLAPLARLLGIVKVPRVRYDSPSTASATGHRGARPPRCQRHIPVGPRLFCPGIGGID